MAISGLIDLFESLDFVVGLPGTDYPGSESVQRAHLLPLAAAPGLLRAHAGQRAFGRTSDRCGRRRGACAQLGVTVVVRLGRPRRLSAGLAFNRLSLGAAPPANLLYGQLTAPSRGSEGELFLCLGLTALVAWGLWPKRRREAEPAAAASWWRANPEITFYVFLAGLAFWASLGPIRLALPPVVRLRRMRVPARLAVLVTLA